MGSKEIRTIILSIVLCLAFIAKAFSQKEDNSGMDSLKRALAATSVDSVKVNILNSITREFLLTDNYDSALKYCNEAVLLAEQARFMKGLSGSLSDRGVIYGDQGNYTEAMKNYEAALKINEEIGDKKSVANSYNFIANTYHVQGDFPNALKNQFSALKIREEIGDRQGIAWSYNNIGVIYKLQGDIPAALKNYNECLKILLEIGDKKTIATAYNNIGNVNSEQRNFRDALNNYFSSLKLRLETGDKRDISTSYNNIGDVFCDLFEKDSVTREVMITYSPDDIRTIPRTHWLDTAMAFQTKALAINNEIGDRYFSIFSMSGMGRVNFLRKNYPQTIHYYSRAYTIAESLNAPDLQKEIAKYLSDSYAKLGDYRNGLSWYMKFSEHKDSLFNEEKTQDLTRTQMKYEFEKRQGEEKAIQDKKDALANAELGRQKKMRNIFFGGFALVLLFAGVFFYQRNDIRKEKTRSDDLLLNILPSEIASELKRTGTAKAKQFSEVTVMFTDFVDFTMVSGKVGAESLVEEIHACFSAFDGIVQKYGIEKIKTIGDAYLCASGLPVPDAEHAMKIVKAAIDMMVFMQNRKIEKELKGEIPFDIRIGIHTGPVVAGIVGVKKYAYDIWGDTVNIAARMEQNSESGKINISSSTQVLVKDKFSCIYRGKMEAKNIGAIDMYYVDASIKISASLPDSYRDRNP